MNEELTHTVAVAVTGRYQHGDRQHCEVRMSGDGGIEHMLDAFRAALVAAGFSPRIAEHLDISDQRPQQ